MKKTKDELQYENMPFNLYFSCKRRQAIIDAMQHDEGPKKKQGEVILQNYKRQLAERAVRERYEKGDMSEKGNETSDQKDSMAQMLLDFENGDVPDPEVLKEILDRKSAFE